jgi:hypothetical protein
MVTLFGGRTRAGGWGLLGCCSMALAAVWILVHGACAMHDGGCSSDGAGTGSSLPALVHGGGTLPRVHGNLGDLPVELFGGALPAAVEEDDLIFTEEHRVNMQVS